jgi:hypothetical protein
MAFSQPEREPSSVFNGFAPLSFSPKFFDLTITLAQSLIITSILVFWLKDRLN